MPIYETYVPRHNNHIHATRFLGDLLNAKEIMAWIGRACVYTPPTTVIPRAKLTIPTPFGERTASVGNWIVRTNDGEFLVMKAEAFDAEYLQKSYEDARLVNHARAELALFPNEDPDFIESLIKTIEGFTSYKGHSGESATIAIHMATALLNGRNLMPLTDDAAEWEFHDKDKYGVSVDMWQNYRNSAAISEDGGKTYYIVGEPLLGVDERKMYTSTPALTKEEVAE